MTEIEMKQRTKAFALRVIKLTSSLSKDFVGRRLGDQLLRSGTSVGANYRAACRARSKAEFASKLGAAVIATLAKPEVKEKLLAIGLIPVGSTPDGLTQELAANTAFWQPIVKATGYKIND